MKGVKTREDFWAEPWSTTDQKALEGAWHVLLLMAIIGAGLLLRMDDLGAVGLYSDEKYTFLAALAVLDSGQPVLPSGMLYPRAMLQTYLVAGSVAAFGENEWAFRLPSVIAGTLCVLLAYFLGRNHLRPALNLAFVASVAFFPGFIEISQIARMYGFLVLAVMLFLIAFTRWERTASWPATASMIVAAVVGIQFHVLGVFVLPLVLVPLLTDPSSRRLHQACLAVAVISFAYVAAEAFSAQQYSGTLAEEIHAERFPPPVEQAGVQALTTELFVGVFLLVLVVVAVLARSLLQYARQPRSASREHAIVLGLGAFGLTLALVAAALVSYHVAGLALFAGAVLYLRGGGRAQVMMLVCAAISIIFLCQAVLVLSDGIGSAKDFIKFFVSFPSPTPEIRFFRFFPVGVAIFTIFCTADLLRFSRGEQVPRYVLFFFVGVLAPMLVMGMMRWSVASRYMLGLVPVFLFCFFLALERYLDRLTLYIERRDLIIKLVAWAAVPVLVPFGALSESMNRSYGPFPDHKGAAEFVRAERRSPSDIVVVMDAPIQTYYLGSVDYLIRSIHSAAWQSRRVGGEVLDIFTATPVVFDAEAFERIINRSGRGAVYVIGSGEIHESNDYDYSIGEGIMDIFNKYGADVVFKGRDDKTLVWKFDVRAKPVISVATEPN